MPAKEDIPFSIPVSMGEPAYLDWAIREAAFWANLQPASMDRTNRPENPFLDRHTNLRFTGSAGTYWYEVIPSYGPFKKGLVLGTSAVSDEAAILTKNPSLHLTFLDISRGALERRQRVLGSRADYAQVDLNFVQLREHSFDVIISSSTLHHVVNLEHLAEQCLRALRPGGCFFLQDCTVESRFQFSPAKIRLFEELHLRAESARGWDPPRKLVWAGGPKSPFCGIRSGEIMDVLTRYFEVVKLAGTAALTGLLLFTRVEPTGRGRKPPLVRRMRPQRDPLRHLVEVDDLMCDAGILVPYNSFAVLRRPD